MSFAPPKERKPRTPKTEGAAKTPARAKSKRSAGLLEKDVQARVIFTLAGQPGVVWLDPGRAEQSYARFRAHVNHAQTHGIPVRAAFWRSDVDKVKRAPRPGRRESFKVVGLPGTGDITGVLADGRVVYIETKRESGGEWSHAQQEFANMVRTLGGIYVLARDVADLAPVLEAIRNVRVMGPRGGE